MSERRYRGKAASPGLAIGNIWRMPEATAVNETASGTPAQEHAKLEAAVAKARADLEVLASEADTTGEAILEFQTEMLDDPALIEDALAEIDMGKKTAVTAWAACMDAQIAAFLGADDDYFRARASDLEDLKERVGDVLAGGTSAAITAPPGAIVLADDVTPSRFLAANWQKLGGLALCAGSGQSHMAMLARARGVPLVVDLGAVEPSADAILDAESGWLIAAPSAATREIYAARIDAAAANAERAVSLMHQPALTPSGERVQCLLNVDDPTAIDQSSLDAADGIGLWRTEFLFLGRSRLPSEDEQYTVYADLLARLGGKSLTLRTLDVGGDKPLPGVTLQAESNPFLGLRGLRLCLEKPDLFRPQVRAILRAAARGPLKAMLPMVSRAAEMTEARRLFRVEYDALNAVGVPVAMPEIGMMVETPASAIAIDTFEVPFVSIGSNDLTQYTMAASRDASGRVASLADPLDPAVLRLIERVVRHGKEHGVEVSLCGDMAAEPVAAERLLGLGLRRLSVGEAALGRLKLAVADHAG